MRQIKSEIAIEVPLAGLAAGRPPTCPPSGLALAEIAEVLVAGPGPR
ncbi:MAG TPA: hypothetical protein VGG25_29335 [Streptosporangiaceae bacterium]|jgi:hypothetical protein